MDFKNLERCVVRSAKKACQLDNLFFSLLVVNLSYFSCLFGMGIGSFTKEKCFALLSWCLSGAFSYFIFFQPVFFLLLSVLFFAFMHRYNKSLLDGISSYHSFIQNLRNNKSFFRLTPLFGVLVLGYWSLLKWLISCTSKSFLSTFYGSISSFLPFLTLFLSPFIGFLFLYFLFVFPPLLFDSELDTKKMSESYLRNFGLMLIGCFPLFICLGTYGCSKAIFSVLELEVHLFTSFQFHLFTATLLSFAFSFFCCFSFEVKRGLTI